MLCAAYCNILFVQKVVLVSAYTIYNVKIALMKVAAGLGHQIADFAV